MTIDDIVKQGYTAKIKEIVKNEDLRQKILNHPRLEKCRGELITNIKKVELQNSSLLSHKTIKHLAESFGKMFARVVLEQEKYRIKSLSERIRLEHEQEKLDEIMKAVDPLNTETDKDDLKRE